MTKKIILITLFVLFAGLLIAGGVYRTSARSGYGISLGGENGIEIPQGAGVQQQVQTGERAGQGLGNNGQPQGRRQNNDTAPAGGSYGQGQGGQGYGRNRENLEQGQGLGPGQQSGNAVIHDMILIEGTVSQAPAAGVDMILETAGGRDLIGTGPGYLQDQGFNLAVGDEVRISGFYENDEFKAVTITRLSDGLDITLRDEYGRPFWSGAGRRAKGGGGQGLGQGAG